LAASIRRPTASAPRLPARAHADGRARPARPPPSHCPKRPSRQLRPLAVAPDPAGAREDSPWVTFGPRADSPTRRWSTLQVERAPWFQTTPSGCGDHTVLDQGRWSGSWRGRRPRAVSISGKPFQVQVTSQQAGRLADPAKSEPRSPARARADGRARPGLTGAGLDKTRPFRPPRQSRRSAVA
jgi:hypothetical protein